MASVREIVLKFYETLVPRERWTPSQWAELAPRVLSVEETSEPGPWRNDRAPYLTAIMDSVTLPGVEEICVLKGAQIGYSEAIRNLLGYWVDLNPGPTLLVMPDQLSAESLQDERLNPLMKHTPAVARHVTGKASDIRKHRARFDTMSIFFAWAGSSQGLKTRPVQNLICEEPDEYPAESGAGGDPLSKALKRVTTYADKGRRAC